MLDLAIVKKYYGSLFEDALLAEIAKIGSYKEVKKDDILIEIGTPITHMPLLLEGVIKILREDDLGDELLIYFLERGDTCAMTLTCCLGDSRSTIRGVAEQDTSLVMVPVEKMEVWITTYKSWRNFVFTSYNSRFMELLTAVDSLAFMKMGERLFKYLVDKSKVINSNEISNTHQEIAYELHTSRVVISRLLKKLENEGRIKLFRNKIKLLKV
jgi:CRP/FNR family transcriptional regulator